MGAGVRGRAGRGRSHCGWPCASLEKLASSIQRLPTAVRACVANWNHTKLIAIFACAGRKGALTAPGNSRISVGSDLGAPGFPSDPAWVLPGSRRIRPRFRRAGGQLDGKKRSWKIGPRRKRALWQKVVFSVERGRRTTENLSFYNTPGGGGRPRPMAKV